MRIQGQWTANGRARRMVEDHRMARQREACRRRTVDTAIVSIFMKFPLIYRNFRRNSRFGVDMTGSIRINKVIYRHHQH